MALGGSAPLASRKKSQVKDVPYFSCPANHGIFVRPTQVASSAGSASPVSPGDEKWEILVGVKSQGFAILGCPVGRVC